MPAESISKAKHTRIEGNPWGGGGAGGRANGEVEPGGIIRRMQWKRAIEVDLAGDGARRRDQATRHVKQAYRVAQGCIKGPRAGTQMSKHTCKACLCTQCKVDVRCGRA